MYTKFTYVAFVGTSSPLFLHTAAQTFTDPLLAARIKATTGIYRLPCPNRRPRNRVRTSSSHIINIVHNPRRLRIIRPRKGDKTGRPTLSPAARDRNLEARGVDLSAGVDASGCVQGDDFVAHYVVPRSQRGRDLEVVLCGGVGLERVGSPDAVCVAGLGDFEPDGAVFRRLVGVREAKREGKRREGGEGETCALPGM